MGCNPQALLSRSTRRSASRRCSARWPRARRCSSCTHRRRAGGARRVALSGLTPVIASPGLHADRRALRDPRAESNVIERIGNRPALEILEEASTRCPTPRRAFPGGSVRRPGNRSGEVTARAGDSSCGSLGADRSSGRPGRRRARAGGRRAVPDRDAEASRWDLRAMLDEVGRAARRSRPAFGCYFNCAGRGRGSSVSPTTTSR